jgi:hypothetical protein
MLVHFRSRAPVCPHSTIASVIDLVVQATWLYNRARLGVWGVGVVICHSRPRGSNISGVFTQGP